MTAPAGPSCICPDECWTNWTACDPRCLHCWPQPEDPEPWLDTNPKETAS